MLKQATFHFCLRSIGFCKWFKRCFQRPKYRTAKNSVFIIKTNRNEKKLIKLGVLFTGIDAERRAMYWMIASRRLLYQSCLKKTLMLMNRMMLNQKVIKCFKQLKISCKLNDQPVIK